MGKYINMVLGILQQIADNKDKIVEFPYNICIGCIALAVIFLGIAIFLDCKKYW